MTETKPEFATNRDGKSVSEAISGHLEYLLSTWAKGFAVDIATAYFNPGGFSLLADELERIGEVRLLLGAEPEDSLAKRRHIASDAPPQRAAQAQLRAALTGHIRSLEEDRDLLGFTYEQDQTVKRLLDWLDAGRVQVRRYENGFLHGKAFIVRTDQEGVISGSSNFTFAGLAKNLELNLGHYQPRVVEQVASWFEELWGEANPFDLAGIYRARFEPHNPYIIYLRMLYERYGAEVEREAQETGVGLHLTEFQRDGVWRAKQMLREYNGVLVADGVGLGKTFLAGELIREAVQERRQRVLLVAPAALRDGPWHNFLQRHQLGVEVVSYEELSADPRLNPKGKGSGLTFDLNDYALIVIDEAHAYRNPDIDRAAILRRLLAGSPPKQLVLLTATPVNNSLWDLYYLLSYFIRNDAEFAALGIRSLRDYFREAMAVDPEDLSPEHLFDVLDAVAVRRTRHFVKRYYPHDTITIDGVQVPIQFPKPVVKHVGYDLDELLPGFFDRFAHALDCGDLSGCEHPPEVARQPVLKLARYVPSAYLVAKGPEARELSLAGLLRSGLLKRFESSAHAFSLTCRRMAASHNTFLQLLDAGYVPSPALLDDWATDADDQDFEGLVSPESAAATESLSLTDYRSEELRRDVIADRDLLLALAGDAEQATPQEDPKLRALLDELATIASEAADEAIDEETERDRRKVLVFSYFADTVSWIHEHLLEALNRDDRLAAFHGRMAAMAGDRGMDGGGRASIVWGFAPKSSEAPPARAEDLYDILVTTDVLAEGVNLQQARHIINYDLPWNPMRLVQRHGRIDRIGSLHDRVFLRCFFPDTRLDQLLHLEDRLRSKIAQAAASVGIESEVLPGSRVADVVFATTREEIERLRQEDPTLFENAGEFRNAFSGEEYRQELRAGLQSPHLADQLRSLPWGSGSGLARVGDEQGFVFCARVGDHPAAIFRYVALRDGADPDVVDDALTCLSHAHAGEDTPRVLAEETHRRAYDAWAVARRDILATWQRGADPRELQPSIPKALREAADLLRRVPPSGFTQAQVDETVDALEAPYGERIVKVIRQAMAAEGTESERSRRLIEVVRELGLEPAPAPEPLPVIALEDVNLVCWMAIVPAESTV